MLLDRRYLVILRLSLLWTTSMHAQPEQLQQIPIQEQDQDEDDSYYIGTGMYDMTGPAAQINFMGYAKASQTAHGIHMRLRARAFIVSQKPKPKEHESQEVLKEEIETNSSHLNILPQRLRLQSLLWTTKKERDHTTKNENTRPADIAKLDPTQTICFVSMDAGMGSDLLTLRVVQRLEELLPPQNQSNGNPKRLCHLENLSISGTHTHSAPAGFLQYTLYQITSLGFSKEVLNAYVEGIAQSVVHAFENLELGTIGMAQQVFLDTNANINRSPTSYLLNPEEERDQYMTHGGDTDKTMLQLAFRARQKQQLKGVLNWYAVHGTSMNATNLLISGDNKGYASYLMEKHVNGNETLPGQGDFVAAFASTNLGDVSPNTAGPKCLDTGLSCDLHSSTCNGKNALCVAFGPGKDMRESTELIGRKQYEMALQLLFSKNESTTEPEASLLQGSVQFRHSFINMSNMTVHLDNGSTVKTCPAALGYAFAAGTTDGPGDFDFSQGQNTSNPFWNMIGGFLSAPSKEQKACHSPKPILLNMGHATLPYAWDPKSVPISIFKIGQLFILNVPAEFTTMAGRRLRRAIRTLLVEKGLANPEITITGLANSYAHYVTTLEEYAGQRYEAASTLYGPHTLAAYIQELERIANDLVDETPSHSDQAPRDLGKQQLSLIPPVGFDTIGLGKKFGSVAVHAKESYVRGVDTVTISFRSANPRNNQRIEGTFLSVDRLLDDGKWKTVYVDGDWSTTFFWKSSLESFGVSFAEIGWEIPGEEQQGIYRICHFGTRRTILGDLAWMTMHSPDWWSLDAFGSIAVGAVVQVMKMLQILNEKVRWTLTALERSQMKDFSGCSRSFLVRVDA